MTSAWGRVGIASLAVFLITIIVPTIDLTVSSWFYRPEDGFHLANLPLFRFVMKAVSDATIGATAIAVVLGLVAALTGRVYLSVTLRRGFYLLATLAIGPGLIVNTLFKDQWGRARPHQIIEFGGAAHFSPALYLSDQCVRNCSFPSGHAALAFWTIAFAFLVPARWRPAAIAVSLVFGGLVGLMRIAQGAHFLSDTVAAAILVVGIDLYLKQLILNEGMGTK